jgi:hypothetical protein
MNGIQIEHILNLIEDKAESNRYSIRREVTDYLKNETNMRDVAKELAEKGQVVIPTTYGGITLTTEDLKLAAV